MSALPQQVIGLPVSYDHYIRHGWQLVPIPPGSKGPRSVGWNKRENMLQASSVLPPGYGVGLAHAYSGTCALDIDDWQRAKELLSDHDIDLDGLYNAPDAVSINSGNPGHGKLLFALPFGVTLPSKKITYQHEGQNKVAYELRCATANGLTVQDVLPPTRHVSGTTYQWGGNGNWQRLPIIPQQLLDLWQSLLDQDGERVIDTATISASWDEIKSALYAINSSCSRDEWITCGMALHFAGSLTNTQDEAFALWDEWSSQSEKYKHLDMQVQWRSFTPDPHGVKLGSLFKIAREHGWVRPIPDVSTMFTNITPTPPKQTIEEITLTPKPPRVDLSHWPDILARRAAEVAVEVGCDPVVPLVAGLSTVCAAANAQTRLHISDTFNVPPILWLMTIGEPSDRKSPGSRPMHAILKTIEHEDKQRYQAEHLIWQGKEARYAAELKAYKEHWQSSDSELANTAIPGVKPLDVEPQPLRLIINDATSQKIVHMAQSRPNGFLLLLDEMANWLNRVNDPRSGDDRGCWIQGYESGPYTMDRVTAGTIHADNLGIAIYGNVQPKVFKGHMSKASHDGLLQRFIPFTIDGDETKMPEDIPHFANAKAEYEFLIRKIHTLPKTDYYLSDSARGAFKDFIRWYLQLRDDERLLRTSDVYMTALGKIEGTCARLALIFHLITSPEQSRLDAETMQRAIDAVKQFIVPSLRYAFAEVAGQKDHLAQWVIDYIIQCASVKPTITLSEIRRSAKRQIHDLPHWQADQDLRLCMDDLQQRGYVTLLDESNKSILWAINANLATLFADYRKSVINAKQRTIELFRNASIVKYRSYNRHVDAVGYEP